MPDDVQRLLQQRRYGEALEELLNLYEKKVFRLAAMMLRDASRAEDVTQDVFMKVWRALPSFDGRSTPSTWLYTIARNTCLTAVRDGARRKTSPLEESTEPASVPTEPRDLALAQCVSRLPDIERQVITLFYWEDGSIKDVAAALGLPEGTVKSHLHRARRALGEMMG